MAPSGRSPASDRKDSYTMAKAIEKAGVLFSTGYFQRGRGAHVWLKEQIANGTFGEITRIRSEGQLRHGQGDREGRRAVLHRLLPARPRGACVAEGADRQWHLRADHPHPIGRTATPWPRRSRRPACCSPPATSSAAAGRMCG